MNPRLFKGLLAVGVLLLAVPVAFAQTTGRIDGMVLDDQGAPLPGVTVSVNSASLQGERLQVTDADGRFRFLALPPGDYALRATLEGFSPLEQTGINVRLDRTVTLQLSMTAGFGDEVTVSGAGPIIDTTSTTTGASFGEELFQELPVSRTFQGLAFAAPGVVSGGLGDNPSIGGASAAENRYVVDGLDTTDAGFGTIATEVPFEFIREVEVKTGGYEAEYGGALGGVLNVITKSGGNDLQGDLFGYWSDDSLQAEAEPIVQFGQDLGFEEYDFGAAIGGKFIQDKLWYFVAVNPSRKDETLSTLTDLVNEERTDTLFYAGKLTWQFNPSHQVVFSAFGDPTDVEDNLARRDTAGLVGDNREQGADNFGATYNGTLSSSLFLELSAGRTDQTFRQTPFRTDIGFYEIRTLGAVDFVDRDNCPGNNENLRDVDGAGRFPTSFWNVGCFGGTFHQENGDSLRDEYRGAFTWFTQTGGIDHELKIGASHREVEYIDHSHYPGPVPGPLFDSNGGSCDGCIEGGGPNDPGFQPGVPVETDGLAGQRWLLFGGPGAGTAILIEYDQDSQGETEEQALFFQDRVRLGDYFSLNLGVRADQYNSTGNLSGTVAQRELDFSFDDQLAPRIGFTWDVARNGRSKLYGHFGQFYESVPLDINARAFGNERFNLFYFYYPEDGSLPTASNPGTHYYSYRLGGGTRVDPDMEPMYTEEYLLGFEYEVLPNVAVGVKYTDRTIESVIEDISVDGGHTYFITNPGGTYTSNPVTGEPLDAPVNFPQAIRDYSGIEVSLNKRFTNNWQLYASYVNSENEGNYGGLFRQDNGQLDPNITSLFDLPELLEGAFGRLPNDREHQFKVYGSYLWPFKLVTGFYGQYLSGTPITKLGAHPTYGRRERFVEQRGTAGTTPDNWNLDLHFEYPFSFGGGTELKLIADVFNVTDEQEPATVDQEWTRNALNEGLAGDCGGDEPNCEGLANTLFGEPTDRQDPRTIRLGVKVSF